MNGLFLRIVITAGTTLACAIAGFGLVAFMADFVIPPSKGPSPYGDWRPTGWGLLLGAPLGGIGGFFLGFYSGRKTLETRKSRKGWSFLAVAGLVSGALIGLAFLPNPFREIFDLVGKLIGLDWIGMSLYLLACGLLGTVILVPLSLLIQLFSRR